MPLLFLVRPLIIGVRKFRAKKQGKEYQPLFSETIKKVEKIKYKLKNRKNGKDI